MEIAQQYKKDAEAEARKKAEGGESPTDSQSSASGFTKVNGYAH